MRFTSYLRAKVGLSLLIIFLSSFAFFGNAGTVVNAATSGHPVLIKNSQGHTSSNNSYNVVRGQSLVISFYFPSCDASCGNETWFANNIPSSTTDSFNPPVTTGNNSTAWTLQTTQNTPLRAFTVTIGATNDAGSVIGTLDITVNVVTSPPGGLWISPQSPSGFTAQGNIFYFAAHAYPTNSGDPAISKVNFTATWPGANWQVACSTTQKVPGTSDWYECNWNIAQAGVPNGPLTVSFDVYNTSGSVNYSPNGEHQGTVNRTAQFCQCVIYVENYFGLSDPTSICCGSNGYAKDMGPYLQYRRFHQVNKPQVGAVIIFQPKFGGVDQVAGHVGIITSVKSVGKNWALTVEGGNQETSSVYSKDNCTDVSNISFAPYPKSDAYVSYWVR